jgi:hypothetical protein
VPDAEADDDTTPDESAPDEVTPEAPAPSRVDPMRSADASTTTWNADSSEDAGPQESGA